MAFGLLNRALQRVNPTEPDAEAARPGEMLVQSPEGPQQRVARPQEGPDGTLQLAKPEPFSPSQPTQEAQPGPAPAQATAPVQPKPSGTNPTVSTTPIPSINTTMAPAPAPFAPPGGVPVKDGHVQTTTGTAAQPATYIPPGGPETGAWGVNKALNRVDFMDAQGNVLGNDGTPYAGLNDEAAKKAAHLEHFRSLRGTEEGFEPWYSQNILRIQPPSTDTAVEMAPDGTLRPKGLGEDPAALADMARRMDWMNTEFRRGNITATADQTPDSWTSTGDYTPSLPGTGPAGGKPPSPTPFPPAPTLPGTGPTGGRPPSPAPFPLPQLPGTGPVTPTPPSPTAPLPLQQPAGATNGGGGGSSVAGPTSTPLTGQEVPTRIGPSRSSALQQLLDRAQKALGEQMDAPTKWDDKLAADVKATRARGVNQNYDRSSERLAGTLAGRGLDYSNIAAQDFGGLEAERAAKLTEIDTEIERERVNDINAGRKGALDSLLGFAGNLSNLEAGEREEERGERGYVDTNRRTARSDALEEFLLGRQIEREDEADYMGYVRDGMNYGQGGNAGSLLGQAAGVENEAARTQADREAADAGQWGQLAQLAMQFLMSRGG